MIALMLLGIIGARTKCSKSIAGAIAICCIVLLTAIVAKENQPKVTEVAPESGKIQTEQNAWGTITVTDDTGVTREYQGCIHISGTYPYETTEYMGLCVSMESAIETGEWSPGMYKLYYESEGKSRDIGKTGHSGKSRDTGKTRNSRKAGYSGNSRDTGKTRHSGKSG